MYKFTPFTKETIALLLKPLSPEPYPSLEEEVEPFNQTIKNNDGGYIWIV